MFSDIQAIADFLRGYHLLEGINIYSDDLEDVAEHCGVLINYFGEYNEFFVGYTITDGDIRTEFIPDINKALQRFETKFTLHQPELIHLAATF